VCPCRVTDQQRCAQPERRTSLRAFVSREQCAEVVERLWALMEEQPALIPAQQRERLTALRVALISWPRRDILTTALCALCR
jgi:hypothetical protein